MSQPDLRSAALRDHDTPVSTVTHDLIGFGRISGLFSCFESFSPIRSPAGATIVREGRKVIIEPGQTVRIYCGMATSTNKTAERNEAPQDPGRVVLTIQAESKTTIYGPAVISAGPVLPVGTFREAVAATRAVRLKPFFNAVIMASIGVAALGALGALVAIIQLHLTPAMFVTWTLAPSLFLAGTRIPRMAVRRGANLLRGLGHLPRLSRGRSGVLAVNFFPIFYGQEEAVSRGPMALLEKPAPQETWSLETEKEKVRSAS